MSDLPKLNPEQDQAITIAIYGRRIEMLEKSLQEILSMKTVGKNTISRSMQKIAKKALRPQV